MVRPILDLGRSRCLGPSHIRGQRRSCCSSKEVEGPADYTHVVKVNMAAPAGEGVVAAIKLPSGCVGGEAVFVPRKLGATLVGAGAEEDDGFLILYVTHRASMTSFCMVRF
jgi:hypothetical protein